MHQIQGNRVKAVYLRALQDLPVRGLAEVHLFQYVNFVLNGIRLIKRHECHCGQHVKRQESIGVKPQTSNKKLQYEHECNQITLSLRLE